MTQKNIITALSAGLLVTSGLCIFLLSKDLRSSSDLSSPQQKGSYAVGYRLVREQIAQGVQFDVSALQQGMAEALAGKNRFQHAELVQMEAQLKDLSAPNANNLAEQNKKIADEFLAQNKSRAGVQVTASGLQYKVAQAGQGVAPKKTDWVRIAYEVKLLSGEVYESSKAHGDWVEIPVTNAFPAMQEALLNMKPGAKWTVYASPELAFGSVPRQGLEANSTLQIELSLQGVVRK